MTERYYRRTAAIVGALFIIATVTSLASAIFLGTALDGADYILNVSEYENGVLVAVVFETILAVSLIGYGILLFPILKKHSEGLAMAYVSILIVEVVLVIIGSVSMLMMLTMGHDYAAGTLEVADSRSMGALLMALREWSILFGSLVILRPGKYDPKLSPLSIRDRATMAIDLGPHRGCLYPIVRTNGHFRQRHYRLCVDLDPLGHANSHTGNGVRLVADNKGVRQTKDRFNKSMRDIRGNRVNI